MRVLCKLLLLAMFVCHVAQAERLTVYAEDTMPHAYFKDGKVAGQMTDAIRELLTRAGFEPDIRLSSWPGILRLAESNQSIIFYPLTRTAEREDKYVWIGHLTFYRSHYFYKRKERTDIQIKKLEDAKNYRVGVVSGDIREEYLLSNNFKFGANAGLINIVNNKEGLHLLQVGRIDLLPVTTVNFEGNCEPNCQEFEVAYPLGLNLDLHLAANKATPPELVERLRRALLSMQRDGSLQRYMSKLEQ